MNTSRNPEHAADLRIEGGSTSDRAVRQVAVPAPAFARGAAAAGSTERNPAIDAGRAICCFAIVLIHTAASTHFALPGAVTPTGSASVEPGHIIDQLCRFGVPYFFLATGYFFKPGPGGRARVTAIASRLALPFLFWAALFNALSLQSTALLASPGFWARLFLQGGSAYHLWYLPGVACGLAIVLATGRILSIRSQVLLGGALYLVGLAFGPYADIIGGQRPSLVVLHFTRDLCFGPVFIATGLWLRASGWRPTFRVAVTIFCLGGLLQLGECFLILQAAADTEFGRDYVLATVPFGIGAFLTALTWPWRASIPATLVEIGLLGLGFYAIHPLFVDLLGRFLTPQDLAMRLVVAAATVPLSYGSVRLLARWPAMRRVVV